MASINFNNMVIMAKKEYMDNLRNNWIVILTIIFIILTLVISFVSGGGSMGDVDITVLGMLTIATMLIPIIAIILGYNTISGEAETRSLSVVQSCPISRLEVYFGKFIGLGSVLTTSIILGFGISGLVIAATGANTDTASYLLFIFLTILLGLVYLSLSLCFSAILKRRTTSLYAGIALFFWAMIIGSVIMGIYFAQGGSFSDMISTGGMPDWMWSAMMILSPSDMYQTATMLAFDMRSSDMGGMSIGVPAFITLAKLMVIFIVWIVVPMVTGYLFYRKRDI